MDAPLRIAARYPMFFLVYEFSGTKAENAGNSSIWRAKLINSAPESSKLFGDFRSPVTISFAACADACSSKAIRHGVGGLIDVTTINVVNVILGSK